MIRSICFTLVGALMFCGTSSGSFVIDDFSVLDAPNSGGATVSSPNSSISVEVTSSTGFGLGTSTGGIGVYTFQATAGDSFTILYDWTGLFENLPGATTGLSISNLSFGTLFGGAFSDWTMTLDTGITGATSYAGGTSISSPKNLQGADQLAFTFEYGGFGTGFGAFGGTTLIATPLIATPEPTSLMMLGSVVAFGLVRRRRL